MHTLLATRVDGLGICHVCGVVNPGHNPLGEGEDNTPAQFAIRNTSGLTYLGEGGQKSGLLRKH